MRVMKCIHLDDCRQFIRAMQDYSGILPPSSLFDLTDVHCVEHVESMGCMISGGCKRSGFPGCECIEVDKYDLDIRRCNHLEKCKRAKELFATLDMPNLPKIPLTQDTHCIDHTAQDCCDRPLACDITGYTDCACVSSSEVDK